MSMEKFGFGKKREAIESLPGPSAEEFAFMNVPWYHGSPKPGLEILKPGGGKLFRDDDGIHIAEAKEQPRVYGKHISEWRLKGPLKIVGSIDNYPLHAEKKALQAAGYVGFYWTDLGISSAVVWDGKNLEKVGETAEERSESL